MKYFIQFTLVLSIFIPSITFAELLISYDIQNRDNLEIPTDNQKIELNKIKNIANKYNIKVTFKGLPWNRSLLMLEKGMIDGVINASYKKNRTLFANYPMINDLPDSSKRLNDGDSYYIYRHKNSKLQWDGKKFHGSGSVATVDRYAVIDDLKKHPNITIKIFTSNTDIIRKLVRGKLDSYAGNTPVTNRLLNDFPALSKNIIKDPIPIRKKEYFLIFSKKTYPQKIKEMQLIWQGLQEYHHTHKE